MPVPSDLRRIDEPVFWELISKARSQAPTTLELPSIDLDKPKGKEWTEEAFATIYPQLVRHYASGTHL